MCGGGRRVVGGGDAAGKGGSGAGTRAGHPGGGREGVFSPSPRLAAREEARGKRGPRLARRIDDSARGHGHLGGGSGAGGRRSADVMDRLPAAWGSGAASVRGRFGG